MRSYLLACATADLGCSALIDGAVIFGRGLAAPARDLSATDAVALVLRASVRRGLDAPVLVAIGVVAPGDAYLWTDTGRELWRRDVHWLATEAANLRFFRGNLFIEEMADGRRSMPSALRLHADDFYRMGALLGARLPASHFNAAERARAATVALQGPASPRFARPFVERPSGRVVMRPTPLSSIVDHRTGRSGALARGSK